MREVLSVGGQVGIGTPQHPRASLLHSVFLLDSGPCPLKCTKQIVGKRIAMLLSYLSSPGVNNKVFSKQDEWNASRSGTNFCCEDGDTP